MEHHRILTSAMIGLSSFDEQACLNDKSLACLQPQGHSSLWRKENMKTPFESSVILDRGGKPSVKELLSSLVFNPRDGTIRLNGDRIVMQRAAVGAELRRELIRLLGRDDAKAFLIRLGFLSGQADARFVRASWPGLDVGDAFTAGTRLHMFSGTVRVETVHNDFDFAKKRFSGEFLWHDSVEAAEFRNQHMHTTEPVCWTQLGYASGYASQFFDTLIVYKEVECAAEGHRSCRVIGKPADIWGVGDPDVAIFRDQVAAEGTGGTVPGPNRVSQRGARGIATSEIDRILLAPVQDRLEQLARTALPVLIAGAPGTGRWRAAQYLIRAATKAAGTPKLVHGSQVTLDLLHDISARTAPAKRGGPSEEIVIDDLASVPIALQPSLARAFEEGVQKRRRPVIVLLSGPPAGQGLCRELWLALSAATVTMPTLASRRDDLPALAKATLSAVGEPGGGNPPTLDADALATISAAPWRGNLPELRAVLAGVLLERTLPGPITALEISRKIAQFNVTGDTEPLGTSSAATLFDGVIEKGGLSLDALQGKLYDEAVLRAGGNLSAAARSLGITRAQLAYRIERMKETGSPNGS
jgi:Activator of aromatic catabolism/V4R domain/Bacterial regulatory protein, Fis family/Sigma-54 interaction domain